MFTGIVEELGTVASRDGGRIRIGASTVLEDVTMGASIAVNGCCLTAVAQTADTLSFDLLRETLDRTSLRGAQPGGLVNLERALAAHARLGGHFVQGHVDGVGGVWDVREEGFSRVVTIGVPAELMRYVVEKGSIAVDGVSLTISALGDDWLQVSLIPETLERTILGEAKPGQAVNLEVDVLAKYVERLAVPHLRAMAGEEAQ